MSVAAAFLLQSKVSIKSYSGGSRDAWRLGPYSPAPPPSKGMVPSRPSGDCGLSSEPAVRLHRRRGRPQERNVFQRIACRGIGNPKDPIDDTAVFGLDEFGQHAVVFAQSAAEFTVEPSLDPRLGAALVIHVVLPSYRWCRAERPDLVALARFPPFATATPPQSPSLLDFCDFESATSGSPVAL